MTKISKIFSLISMLLIFAPSISAQRPGDKSNKTPIVISNVAKIRNNGKILSKKGNEAVFAEDLTACDVRKDTLYLTLKEDALKRIDKDPANYMAKSITKKKSASKKKKASGK
ncbi:MAG: hypothetical protein K2K97_04795 [Muribaculaceae bacterium]|nr:hypothetical protein [Muribaculaceae bacterium]